MTPSSRFLQQHHYRHPPTPTQLTRANAPAYRTRHNIGNSALPPLPPTTTLNSRSHSLDGLLENEPNAVEGSKLKSSKNEIRRICDSKENARKTKNRRSKSLDDLIDDEDEDSLLILVDAPQSMENIEASNDSLAVHEEEEKLCENEVMIVDDNSRRIHEEEESKKEMSELDDSGFHDGTSSFDDSVSISSSSPSEQQRKSGNFLNKYVKKVKNLMKK